MYQCNHENINHDKNQIVKYKPRQNQSNSNKIKAVNSAGLSTAH